MREVPVRAADGTIAHFVDPHALEAPQASVKAAPDVPEEPAPRRARALRSDERTPLGDLLGPSPAPQQPHPNRSFTTGMAAGLIGALIVAGLVIASHAPPSAPVASPTSARATANAPTSAARAPAVSIAPPTLGRALVAYAAPDGGVVGALNADRVVTLTGVFGSDWVQLQTADSGSIWVKRADLPSSLLDPLALAHLPDLAPPPTATVLPAPTLAPIARPIAPMPAPASTPAVDRAPASGCTPDRVVAIVARGSTQVASCISLQDAQASLPDATVIAASADEAQALYARIDRDATAFAQP